MEKAFVLLVHVEQDTETYVSLYHTLEALIEDVLNEIKRHWEEIHFEDVGEDENRDDLEKTLEDAKKHLTENGCWNWAEMGMYYYWDEKRFVA